MITFFRTIYWYLFFAVSLLFMAPKLSSIRKKKASMTKEEYETGINKLAGQWAAMQVKNTGAKVKVVGEENIPDGTVVFISNHQSNFDIALFLYVIKKNTGYVAKSEMMKIPLLRDWMKELNCVFMDRHDIKQSLKCILQSIDIVKSGYSMAIFPEGTRSKGLKMGEFKSGSFKLATKSKAPIVPVTINGTYKLMEAQNNKIKPAEVVFTIHKPVETAGLTKEDEITLPDKIKDIIGSALYSDSKPQQSM